jgi:CheY-like chemotaxis protein
MKTVLLVEGVDLLREMLRDLLESMNMQVLAASNAAAAIRIGRSHPGKIDLLLTDVEMGGKSWCECANEIARNRPDIRVVCMSDAISPLEWDNYKERPSGSHLIQKPFRSEELKALVMAILAE